MRVYLCLPAFNEEPSIDPLFQRIHQLNQLISDEDKRIRVILYDDGSTDATVQKVQNWSSHVELTLIRGSVNQGLGVAVRNLLRHYVSVASDDDVAVIMDCDDTHDPFQIPEMLPLMDTCDVVTASRYRRGSSTSGVPFHRLVVSLGFMVLAKCVLPISGARDYSCGFRAYSTSILKRVSNDTNEMFISETGFAAMPELLWNCRLSGARVGEIPMTLAYDRKLSDSKMDVSANSKNLMKLLLRLRIAGSKTNVTERED